MCTAQQHSRDMAFSWLTGNLTEIAHTVLMLRDIAPVFSSSFSGPVYQMLFELVYLNILLG